MLRRFTFFIFLIIFTSSNIELYSQNSWKNIGPGGGSDLQSILVHPTNPNIVYTGGDIEGIFKSTDGGSTWKNINANMATGPWTPDVYWTNQIKFDLADNTFNTLFLCTAVALFKTADAGATWSKIFPSNITSESDLISVYSIAQDPNSTNILYAGTQGKGVYKSTDGGNSWVKLTVPIPDSSTVYETEIAQNGTLFIAATNGIYSSTDGGANWTSKNNGLPHTIIWNFKIHEHNGQRTLFAALPTTGTEGNASTFKGGLYKSIDDGNNWTDITGNLPKMQTDGMFYFYWKFTVNPTNTNTIFIGTSVSYPEEGSAAFEDWGVYKTVDGGTTWTRSDVNVTLGWMDDTFFDERHALVLAMAPSDPNTVYWGRDWMNKTTDGGNNWTQIYTQKINNTWKGTGFELMMVEDMAFSPLNQNKIFIGYDDMGPFRSDDNTNTFIPLDPKMDPYDGYDAAKDIFIDPSNGDIYMSRYDGMGSALNSGYSLGRIYKSSDDGVNWTNISTGFPDGKPALVADFSSGSAGNRTLYATSYGNGVYKSTNSGASWTAINNGLASDASGVWKILLNPNDTDVLYVGINKFGSGGSLYKTSDGGSNWSKLTKFPAMDVLSLQYDKTNNIIYAGATENFDWSMNGGIYKSTDGGSTWSKISDLARVVDISIHPTNPNILFAAAQSWYSVWQPNYHPGVYRSNDGGSNWTNITENLAHTFVTFVRINPNNPNQLFVGTGGGGLWVNDNATSVERIGNTVPSKFSLSQNYPNPFNPNTAISYTIGTGQLSAISFITLKVYDALGRVVAILVNKEQPAGNYKVNFDASSLTSGIYFYRIVAGSFVQTKKMVLLK